MSALALVDTNILVYRFDPRFPEKQRVATELLRRGLERDDVRIAHQSVLEFVAVVRRPLGKKPPLLTEDEVLRETEELLTQFTVLYPTSEIVRGALRGMVAYQLNWFDAHLWAYAEHYGLGRLISEDFQAGRRYGTVLVENPFVEAT